MPERIHDNMSAGDLLKAVVQILTEAGIPEPESDARILFEGAAGMDRQSLLLHRGREIGAEQTEILKNYLRERLTGTPVQYILKEAWFCGMPFFVTPDVLIPRFDTEVLAEEAKKEMKPGMRVLDLCTGSGCIIIYLAKTCRIQGTGSDLSGAALAVANSNNKRHGAGCVFIHSDIFENIDEKYDRILSNPPYIRSGDIPGLMREVRDHEPHLALDGGQDGLEIYRRIAEGAAAHLEHNGRLLMEIGYDQAEDVRQILEENGFSGVEIVKDLSGNDRVIKAEMRSGYV